MDNFAASNSDIVVPEILDQSSNAILGTLLKSWLTINRHTYWTRYKPSEIAGVQAVLNDFEDIMSIRG